MKNISIDDISIDELRAQAGQAHEFQWDLEVVPLALVEAIMRTQISGEPSDPLSEVIRQQEALIEDRCRHSDQLRRIERLLFVEPCRDDPLGQRIPLLNRVEARLERLEKGGFHKPTQSASGIGY